MTSICGKQSALYVCIAALASVLLNEPAAAQEHVRIHTQGGADIAADIYGSGSRGVVLAHGGRFTKADWAPQAALLAAHGFHVLAFDFRGFGESLAPSPQDHAEENVRLDVLAAVRYLHVHGAQTVSVVGASFGGSAAADASADSAPGEIDRVVLLAHGSSNHPELIKGRKLFIVSRHDTDGSGTVRLTEMREDYEKVPPPKHFVVLEGSAHAQFIFKTSQGDRLMNEILKFLEAP
jgi:alpha/beta superfamily hydrolase